MQLQRGKKDVVAGAVGKLHVQRAALLAEGKVLLAVDGKGEDGGIGAEGGGGAVALMDVAVQHDGAVDAPLTLQDADGDGGIVEDAEALAVAGAGVVRAARQVHRDPPPARRRLVQRRARGGDGRATGAAGALDHLRAPRKADAPLLQRGQRAFAGGGQVRGLVHQRQLVPRCVGRLRQLVGTQHALGQAALAHPGVLYHRETVSHRQRQNVAVGVERAHRSAPEPGAGHGIPATLCVCTDIRHGGPSSITAAMVSP